jgi:DUF4097 and DUF4098 domain-containing protein YvlB
MGGSVDASEAAMAGYVEPAVERQDDGYDSDLAERDEIKKSVELAPGSQVEVSGINGSVTVETSSGATAEIHIIRSARTREDLNRRRVLVEEGPGSLKIRGESDKGRGPDVRQRVMLKLPRSVELTVKGINGRVSVGEIDGMIHVSGINGSVEVAHAMSTSDISGINGRVRIALDRVHESGMSISGVNGKVELYFNEAVNADVSVTGINGQVRNENGSITVIGKISPSNFRGKIGAGGPEIRVSGVNGNVELLQGGAGQ